MWLQRICKHHPSQQPELAEELLALDSHSSLNCCSLQEALTSWGSPTKALLTIAQFITERAMIFRTHGGQPLIQRILTWLPACMGARSSAMTSAKICL